MNSAAGAGFLPGKVAAMAMGSGVGLGDVRVGCQPIIIGWHLELAKANVQEWPSVPICLRLNSIFM